MQIASQYFPAGGRPRSMLVSTSQLCFDMVLVYQYESELVVIVEFV
jgi:hypothetical protein